MASSTRHVIVCIVLILAIVIDARSQSGTEKRPGRTISGTMSGPGIEGGFVVSLTTVAPAGSQQNVSRSVDPGMSQFTFPGIAEGDYHLTAHSYSQGRELLLSEPTLIRLRGADINDVELTVTTLGSISGRVVLEESKLSECQGKQPPEF